MMPALAAALVKFQSTVPPIEKKRTAKIPTKAGGQYSYKYADLADIWESVRKPLAAAGLAVTQLLVTDKDSGSLTLDTTVWHESGESFGGAVVLPAAGKTPQEVGSLITYYKRYALGAALGIATEDDDDGAAGLRKPEPRKAAAADFTGPPDGELFEDPAELLALIGAAVSPTQLAEVGKAVAESPLSPDGRSQLKAAYSARMRELKAGPA